MTWVEEYLREDVGDGDINTLALIGGEVGAARIRATENGVVAGLEQAMEVFRHLGLKVTPLARDGEAVSAGANILSVEGPLRSILTGERLALNFLIDRKSVV